LANCPDKLII